MGVAEVPVLVVGGGGCGLTLSNLLSDHGVGHLLVERHTDTSRVPKAHYLNQRSMEVFRQHGLDAPIIEHGASLEQFGKVRWLTSLAGESEWDAQVIHEMDAFGGGGLLARYSAAAPVLPVKLPQNRLEPILRRHAEQRNPEGTLFGHELTDLAEQEEHVLCHIRDLHNGQTSVVRARYVIAADGGRTVGAAVGVEMQGRPDWMQVTTAYFSADLSPWWQAGTLITHFLNPHDPDLSSNLIEMGPTWGKDCQEWVMHFPPGEPSRIADEAVVPRVRQVLGLPELDVTLHHVGRWTVEAVLADRYRQGRTLLIGDAAHRHIPTVGLGLNTGIQDAHNLAWKLAAVLAGRAPDALLDTYEAERRPIGRSNIDWAMSAANHHHAILQATGLGPNVPSERRQSTFATYFTSSAMGQLARARTAELFQTHRGGCQAHDIEIGFGYDQGALVADGSPPPPRVPMRDVHHPCTRPGHVLPHAWLKDGGRLMSTHDLATASAAAGPAPAFALLVGAGGAPWQEAAVKVADQLSVPLHVAEIGAGGRFADADGRWPTVRQVDDEGAILVRPDNHVAWRSMGAVDDPAGALADALTRVLSGSS